MMKRILGTVFAVALSSQVQAEMSCEVKVDGVDAPIKTLASGVGVVSGPGWSYQVLAKYAKAGHRLKMGIMTNHDAAEMEQEEKILAMDSFSYSPARNFQQAVTYKTHAGEEPGHIVTFTCQADATAHRVKFKKTAASKVMAATMALESDANDQ